MILKLTAILCGSCFLAFGIGAALRTPQEYTKDRSIASLARQTKKQGKTKVEAPGLIVDYPGENIGLDEAVQNYSVLIAEPIESKSFIADSSDEIRTAYKFKILETVSQKTAVFCNTCPPINDVSAKLQPALQDEFLLELSGGTVTVDGVEITMTGDIPRFEERKRYLLFVSFTPGGMANLAAGPSGLFRIMPDESLEAIDKGNHRLPAEITTRFSKSLSGLKRAAKR